MDLYSAPRPPRKKPQPRAVLSGKFQSIEPIDDAKLFEFVRDGHRSLLGAVALLQGVKIGGDEVEALRARDFVVSYLHEVAATLAPHLVVGEAKPRNMGFCDD